eukprot:3559066-Prymnesium_polylepis.1
MFLRGWRVWKEIARIGQAYYPELLGTVCIVRGPAVAAWGVNQSKKFLDPDTAAKIELFSGDAVKVSPATRALPCAKRCAFPFHTRDMRVWSVSRRCLHAMINVFEPTRTAWKLMRCAPVVGTREADASRAHPRRRARQPARRLSLGLD